MFSLFFLNFNDFGLVFECFGGIWGLRKVTFSQLIYLKIYLMAVYSLFRPFRLFHNKFHRFPHSANGDR